MLFLRSGLGQFLGFHVVAGVAVFFGVFADVLRDLHGAEGGAAHRAEVSRLCAFGGEGFVVEVDRSCGVESEGELVAPAEFEAGLGYGVVAFLGGGVALCRTLRN